MPGKTFRQKPRSKNNKKSKKNHSNNKKSRKQLKGGMKARTIEEKEKYNERVNRNMEDTLRGIDQRDKERNTRLEDVRSSILAAEKKEKEEDYAAADKHNFLEEIHALSDYGKAFSTEIKKWVPDDVDIEKNPQYKAILEDVKNNIKNDPQWPWIQAMSYRDMIKLSDTHEYLKKQPILKGKYPMMASDSENIIKDLLKNHPKVLKYRDDLFDQIMDDSNMKYEDDKYADVRRRYIEQIAGADIEAKKRIEDIDNDSYNAVTKGFKLNPKQNEPRLLTLPLIGKITVFPISYYHGRADRPDNSEMLTYMVEKKSMDGRLVTFDKLLDNFEGQKPGLKSNVRKTIIVTDDNGDLMKDDDGNTIIETCIYFDPEALKQAKQTFLLPESVVSFGDSLQYRRVKHFDWDLNTKRRNDQKIAAAEIAEHERLKAWYLSMGWTPQQVEQALRKKSQVKMTTTEKEWEKNLSLYNDLNKIKANKEKNAWWNNKEDTSSSSIKDVQKSSVGNIFSFSNKEPVKIGISESLSAKSDSSEKAGDKRDRYPDDESTKEEERYKIRVEIRNMIQDTVDKMISEVYLADLEINQPALDEYKYYLRETFNSKTETFNLDKDEIKKYLNQQFQNDSYYRYVYKNFLKKQKDLESDKKEYDKIGKGQKAFATLQADFEASRLKAAKEAAEQDKKSQAVSYEPNNLFNLPESKGIRHYLGEVRVSTDPKYFRQKPYFKHP